MMSLLHYLELIATEAVQLCAVVSAMAEPEQPH